MSHIPIGSKYWKVGDRTHMWIVDAIVPDETGQPAFAVLVSADGLNAEDVDLTHLEDPRQYTPVQ